MKKNKLKGVECAPLSPVEVAFNYEAIKSARPYLTPKRWQILPDPVIVAGECPKDDDEPKSFTFVFDK